MSDFDLQSMDKVVAFIGEADDQVRKELRQILNHAGVKQVSAHGSLSNLSKLIAQVPPDLLILADDLDPGVFDFIRDIRHNKIGTNPFVLITTLIAPNHVEAVKRAMQAGTDDIIIKPVKEEQLLQRLKRVTVNRAAFVVTSDYLGPDRRAKSRPSAIRRINVLNTMLEKANGRDVDLNTIRDAVEGSMNEVLQARLDSHGYRLGFVCNLILEAYESNQITEEVQGKLEVLVDLLRDAAKTAERLEERELALLCGSLSRDVSSIAERYATPTPKDIDLIKKLSRAVVSAVKPRTPPDKLDQETRQAADVYQQRDRTSFGAASEIHRSPGEAPVVAMDEPIIEILPLAKGQFLFRQGDPPTSAYILNSGAIGIFKESDGKRIPVARVKKGEFFGEMAIIDSRPRRNSAMALEDCTLSLVSKEMIEDKLAASDPLVRTVLHMLSNSLRMVHDAYAPKGRSMSDSVREIREQARHIRAYLESAAEAAVRKEGAEVAQKVVKLSEDLAKLIESVPDLDRRTPALPSEKDLGG
ncbi:MAG: cyclic nucleotide-binding domain-containing protein [Proteobacteria bacterium]|nr:cyclic nucleotide-binding domain-containing protein [Pseudomonadota bacterium]